MNRSDVENVLLEIGIPAGVKGFKYITDAIMILDDSNWNPKGAITLYNRIAGMNNTTGSRVERAIRHSFEIARSPKGNYDAVEHYIGFMNCQNKNSLKMLYYKIKEQDNVISKKKRETNQEELIRKIVRQEIGRFFQNGLQDDESAD